MSDVSALCRRLRRAAAACECVAAVLVWIAGAGAPAIAADARIGADWVGTWATAPMRVTDVRFSQQTLRQVVHTSVSGTRARVHLSNAFGTRTIRISNVHIALRDNGSAIHSRSDRRVTFDGRDALSLRAGDDIASDPVEFAVPANADVAISFYIEGPSGDVTGHQVGLQTNYVAKGDVASSSALDGAATIDRYYFLTGLDVYNAASRGAVATLGASITDGWGSPPDANVRWPNILARRITKAGLNIGVLNQGIAGNRLLNDGTGPSAEARFDRDVVEQTGVRWVIFSDNPINDFGASKPMPDAKQVIAGIERLIARAHAHGLRFMCSTLTPYQGAFYWTPQGETQRQQVNAFVRRPGNGCDAVMDLDRVTHDPANPSQFSPAFDSGDHLHPNFAGLQAIANAVDLNALADD